MPGGASEVRLGRLTRRLIEVMGRASGADEALREGVVALAEAWGPAWVAAWCNEPGGRAARACSGQPGRESLERLEQAEKSGRLAAIRGGAAPVAGDPLTGVPGFDWAPAAGHRFISLVPLVRAGATVGAVALLNADDTGPGLEAILAVADLLALGVAAVNARPADARHESETASRLRQLEILTEALSSWISTDNWQGAAERLLKEAMDQTASEYGFVGVVVKGPVLRVLAWSGFNWDAVVNRKFYEDILASSEASGYLDFPKLTNLFGWPILNAQSLVTNDPDRDARSAGRPPGHPSLKSYIGIPILRDGQVVGTFGLANREGGYGPPEVERLETLARLATVFCTNYFAHAQRQTLESQLIHAQRMQAIGKLAGGVAHDFNNLTTVVLGYSQGLLEQLPPQHAHREPIAEIHAAAERAASLTRQLLAYSRKQMLNPRTFDLNEVITGINAMLKRLIGENIGLSQILARDLWKVNADPSQMEQVVVNLVVNARDAMPGGGRITIETTNITLTDEHTRSHPSVAPGPHVMLAVTDTGHGMDARTRERIFEPFFTTKEVGKGTGLGLSTIHGIVSQSCGHIRVDSEPGKGSTFRIYLPRAGAPDAVEPADRRGGETVLLAEDEDGVRRFARSSLLSLGYTVIDAADADDAMRLAREFRAPIDLLVTDVIMPGMDGPSLYERLHRHRPGLKVLYISGYAENAIVQHGVLDAGVAFLPKPFSAANLGRVVREVLDAG